MLDKKVRTYTIYACYWLIVRIENTILISIWYTLSSDDGFWYHSPAIAYMIPTYFASIFIKTYQTYQAREMVYEFDENHEISKRYVRYVNKGKPVSKWVC